MLALPLMLAAVNSGSMTIKVPDVIDSIPALGARLEDEYTCFNGSKASISIARSSAGVQIVGLSGFGRKLSEEDRGEWNGWLSALTDLRSSSAQCTDNGVVVFLTGTARGEGRIKTVVVAWRQGKLMKLSD